MLNLVNHSVSVCVFSKIFITAKKLDGKNTKLKKIEFAQQLVQKDIIFSSRLINLLV